MSKEKLDSIDEASWDFMSVTEMDESFPKRREVMKSIIGRRDKQISNESKLEVLEKLRREISDKKLNVCEINSLIRDSISELNR